MSFACFGVTGESPSPLTLSDSATPMSAAPTTWMIADVRASAEFEMALIKVIDLLVTTSAVMKTAGVRFTRNRLRRRVQLTGQDEFRTEYEDLVATGEPLDGERE